MPKLRHRGRGVHGERGCIAGHVSRHVADHDDELRAVIGRSRWRRRVRRGSCAANRRSVFVPLIAQRSSSGSGNAEGRRLTAGDGLTGRRNHDSGSAWKIGSGATCASCREKAHHADGEQYNQSPKAHNHTSK